MTRRNLLGSALLAAYRKTLGIAAFRADVTPPIGAPLCHGIVEPAKVIVDRLSARGIVLFSGEKPVVLCAVDWVGIENGGYEEWVRRIAGAAGTTPDRVTVHTLHQHDAPAYDSSTEKILAEHGLAGRLYDVKSGRESLDRVEEAVRAAVANPAPVTHVALGRGKVERVASSRRVLGADGKVQYIRLSSSKDPAAIAAPEGVIDPYLRLIGFWNGDQPVASVTYYATHPQSYYGKGGVSADFVGMARALREAALPQVAHIHFNGASGNVAAGKYNDGSHENRPALAQRLAAGMEEAWRTAVKHAAPAKLEWRRETLAIPVREGWTEAACLRTLDDAAAKMNDRLRAARDLVWIRRMRAGDWPSVSCLRLGRAAVVHMPGELFVEYQLAAQKMRPADFVAMAAYGDLGPGYVGTAIAYSQGGYETGPVSRVGPDAETVLLGGIRKVLS